MDTVTNPHASLTNATSVARPLIFISASHVDREWRDRIKAQLERHSAEVEWWDDSRIEPGAPQADIIELAIQRATIALILLSPEYLSSDVATAEFRRIVEGANHPRPFPVVVRECAWRQIPSLRRIQVWSGATPLDRLTGPAAEHECGEIAQSIVRLATAHDGPRAGEEKSATEGRNEPSEQASTSPQLRFSKTVTEVLRMAREIAGQRGSDVVNSSGLLFALADSATGLKDTAYFVREQMDRDGRYDSARRSFLASSSKLDGVRRILGQVDVGATTENAYRVLLNASAIAANVTPGSEIRQRHLFAALLVPTDAGSIGATRRLSSLAGDLDELRKKFRRFIAESVAGDVSTAWDEVLGAVTTPTSGDERSPKHDAPSDELTVAELLADTEVGRGIDSSGRTALRIAEAFARQRGRSTLNSFDLLAGYLVFGETYPSDSMKSSRALVDAVWASYAATHPEVDRAGNAILGALSVSIAERESLIASQEHREGGIAVSRGAMQMLTRSVEVAVEAERPQPFSSRHLIACLLGPREWPHDPEGAQEIQSRIQVDLPTVRRAYRDWIAGARKDKIDVIDAVLGLSVTSGTRETPTVALRRGFQPTFSRFTADRAASRPNLETPLEDALGVGVYAGHLAQLIAAKETPMPLSIGLFGAWGAGKSHFMDLLDERLIKIGEKPSKAFHSKIVQIRFNAWHYLDTSLWASLVCEIFDQLFTTLEGRKDTTDEQVEKLKLQLTEQSALHAEADEALKVAKSKRADADEKLRTAMLARDARERTVRTLLDDVGSLLAGDATVKRELREVAAALNLPQLSKSFDELEARALEVQSIGGRAKALAMAIFNAPGWWRRAILLGVVVAIPFVVTWIANQSGLREIVTATGRTILQVALTLGGLSTWLAKQVKTGNGVLAKLESAYGEVKRVRDERRSKDKDTIAAQKDLAAARRAEDEARQVVNDVEERVKVISAELAELAPGRQLMRFLKSRASAEDYRRHLGLVSLVRKDFEQLSKLLGKASKGEDPTLPKIDRIVLYIDDLDRCRADRVIEVLEAVHLLLAFPLFTVVVAVDPRWLRQSLLEHYPRLLGGGDEQNEKPGARLVARPATSQDYLEKIFQVPFNLQPMEKDGFENLVTELFPAAAEQPGLSTQVEKKAVAPPPSAEPGQTVQPPAVQVSHADVVSPPVRDVVASETTPALTPKLESVSETKEVIPEAPPDPTRLILSGKEVADIKNFQPLFVTPRAVKRFANTYSLIRVAVKEEKWNEYLGDGETPGTYRVPMLLLAVTSAFPSLAQPWLRWLREQPTAEWGLLEPAVEELMKRYGDTTARADWDRLSAALASLALTDWPAPDRPTIDAWVGRVARYSF